MHITLVPYAGLCNRLNAIASGLAYKMNHSETELVILWHKRRHCNCRFKDLFKQLPPQFTPVHELFFQFRAFPGTRLNLNIPQFFRPIWYDYSFLPGYPADDFDMLTNGKQRVYVHKDNRFCKESISHSLATIFRPVDDLQKRIDEVTKDWNGKVIGLHIRRTDNKAAIAKSPMAHFYEVIDKELAKDGEIRFYLATDDEEVKTDLRGRYGEKIITISLCLKRSSVQGMKDAVVDLYCLGSTQKIYGSAQSTYSTFASQLFDKELIV